MYGKARFPNFSGELYRVKWSKFCELVKEVETHEVHGDKLDNLCCEIARTGM